EQLSIGANQRKLDLAAGIAAGHFDFGGSGEAGIGHPIVDRRGSRTLHAQFLQLNDMLFKRDGVASRPTSNNSRFHRDEFARGLLAIMDGKFNKSLAHGAVVNPSQQYGSSVPGHVTSPTRVDV